MFSRPTVNDHDFLGVFLCGESIQDSRYGLTKLDTSCFLFLRRLFVDVVVHLGMNTGQDVGISIWVTTSSEVLDSSFDGDDIVTMSGALNVLDSRRHQALTDDLLLC